MVDIVMATYNGAQFVDEQIRSFCNQTYADWRCIVHDDGSSDGTQDILRAWAKKDKRIVFVEDGVQGLGPAKHFLHILQYSDAPWVVWSDQDDIWFDHKIETMLRAGEQAHFAGPGVVYANAEPWSPERGVIAPRNTLFYPKHLRDMLFLNSGIQGASAFFNAPMRDLMQIPLDCYAMHDHALLLAALTMGEIVYIDRSLMYYRQHETNVTGHAPGSKMKKAQLMWQHRHVPVLFRTHYDGTKAFYERFKDRLREEDKKVLDIYFRLPEQNPFSRFWTICRTRFTLLGSRWVLLIKLCIRPFI